MNKKMICGLVALVIVIIGIIVTCIWGLNQGINYDNSIRINIYMKEPDTLDRVKEVMNENFDGSYEATYTDDFKDTVTIKVKEISEEKIEEIKGKINEKFNFSESDDQITVIDVPKLQIFDLIKSYIKPVIISFVIVLVYFAIAFRKLGIVKSVVEPLLTVILVGAVYVSIFAICRIPVNELFAPIGIIVYMIALLVEAVYLNKKVS